MLSSLLLLFFFIYHFLIFLFILRLCTVTTPVLSPLPFSLDFYGLYRFSFHVYPQDVAFLVLNVIVPFPLPFIIPR